MRQPSAFPSPSRMPLGPPLGQVFLLDFKDQPLCLTFDCRAELKLAKPGLANGQDSPKMVSPNTSKASLALQDTVASVPGGCVCCQRARWVCMLPACQVGVHLPACQHCQRARWVCMLPACQVGVHLPACQHCQRARWVCICLHVYVASVPGGCAFACMCMSVLMREILMCA